MSVNGMRPALAMVVAMARNGVIGRDGGLPWRLPDDLRHFREVTWGKPVIMGRRTWQSLGKPLAGRHNIVLSRDRTFEAVGADVVHDLDAALDLAARTTSPTASPEPVVIGGVSLYREALPRVGRIWLTEVDADPQGDCTLSGLDLRDFVEVASCDHAPDERHAHAFRIRTLERRARPESEAVDGVTTRKMSCRDRVSRHT